MSAFPAKYGGRCAHCPNRIIPGDEVVYVDDELGHLECEDNPPPTRRPAEVCPDHWLEQPCGECEDS